MIAETRAPVDRTERLARAAVAAIADTVPTIEADPKAVRYLLLGDRG
jgi:hypothetical protein